MGEHDERALGVEVAALATTFQVGAGWRGAAEHARAVGDVIGDRRRHRGGGHPPRRRAPRAFDRLARLASALPAARAPIGLA